MSLHVGNIAHGIKAAVFDENSDIHKVRLKICQAGPCPHYKQILGINYCNGCWCPTRTKLRVIKETCPINKW